MESKKLHPLSRDTREGRAIYKWTLRLNKRAIERRNERQSNQNHNSQTGAFA